MEHPKRLRQAVTLAIEAGDVAASATHRIATGNTEPGDIETGLRGMFERWARRSSGPAVTRTQVERTCENLDDFVTTIEDVNAHVATPDERIDTSHDWSARLDQSIQASVDLHNEVTATLGVLGRYRTNIVLGRPLLEQSDTTESDHE